MRKIKFRAWDGRKMIGDNLDIEDLMSGILLFKLEFIWMQFTGLKDKNGKDIYEGDITPYENTFLKVEWNRSQYRYSLFFTDTDDIYCHLGLVEFEIIGNIHENPELLTEKS